MQEKKLNIELFASRLGFILVAAGCAVGLGNVWRFPFITGQYGGGYFVLMYIVFLFLLGIPILVMELSVGRASHGSVISSFGTLTPSSKSWAKIGRLMFAGNYILLSYYCVVSGWFLYYFYKIITGGLTGLDLSGVQNQFGQLVSDPITMQSLTVLVAVISVFVCAFGIKKGVEKVNKMLMGMLFVFMIALAIYSVSLNNGIEGVKYFLVPDMDRLLKAGVWNAVYAALSQAFFTLGLGIGSIQIFGSYCNKNKSLMNEAIIIAGIDTVIAIFAGIIIFSATFSMGISPDSGPSLIFITLVNMFSQMQYGTVLGAIFFAFMIAAALSTMIAICENVIMMLMEALKFRISRVSSSIINGVIISIITIPCVLGFNVWSSFEPLGKGSMVLDLEDFILSNNIVLIGGFCYIVYCTRKIGWGIDNFYVEANTGQGLKLPKTFAFYLKNILPFIILVVMVMGYLEKFVF